MLNLGDLNFGIDVDTSPLGASISKLQQFGQVVERVSRMTSDGAAEAAAALRRQEQAAIAAYNTVASFQQRVYRQGGSQDNIDQTTIAFTNLISELTRGEQAPLAFQRAMEAFRVEMATARREMIEFVDTQKQLGNQANQKSPFFADSASGSRNIMRMQQSMQKFTEALAANEVEQSKFFSQTQSGSSSIIRMAQNVQDLVEALAAGEAGQSRFFSQTQAGSANLIRMHQLITELQADTTVFGEKLTLISASNFSKLVGELAGVKQSLLSAAESGAVFEAELRRIAAAQVTRSRTGFQSYWSQQTIQEAISGFSQVERGLHSLQDAEAAFGSGVKGGTSVVDFLRDLTAAATLTFGPLNQVGVRVLALGSLINRQNLFVAGAVAGFAGMTAGLIELAAGAVKTATALSTIQQRLIAVGGNTSSATVELTHLHDEAARLGLNFIQLADSFSRFSLAATNSGLNMKQIQNIFDTFSAAGAKLHLPAEDMQRIFLALEQMLSKGTVSSEELRRQLGNALPGAFRLAADAMGVTQEQLNKLLKSGSIASIDLLPKLADQIQKTFGVDSTTTVDTLVASYGKLSTATTDLFQAFDQAFSISTIWKDALDGLTATFEVLATHMGDIKTTAEAIAIAVAFAFGPAALGFLNAIIVAIGTATDAMLGFNAATLANPFVKFEEIALRVGLALVGFAGGMILLKNNTDNAGNSLEAQTQKILSMKTAADQAGDSMAELARKQLVQAKATEDAMQAQIYSDYAKLQKFQQMAAPNAGDEFGKAWGVVQKGIEGANRDLTEHEQQMDGIRQKIKELTAEYNNLLGVEGDATTGITTDQDDARKAVDVMINRQLALINAAGKGKDAVQRLKDQFASEDWAARIGKTLVSKTGWSPEQQAAVVALLATLNDTERDMTKYQRDQEQFAKTAQQTAEAVAQAQAVMIGGPGLSQFVQQQSTIADREKQVFMSLMNSSHAYGASKAAAEAYGNALRQLAAAQQNYAQQTALRTIVQTEALGKALAKAFNDGEGAYQNLQHQFQEQEEIRRFSEQMMSIAGNTALAYSYTMRYAEALKQLDAAARNNALSKIDQDTARLQSKINTLQNGGGQWELDQIDLQNKFDDTVKQVASSLMAQGASYDEARTKAIAFASTQEKLRQVMATSQASTRDLFVQFAADADQASSSISDSLASMARTGDYSMKGLVSSFGDMVQQMLSDAYRLMVIKPLLKSIFGDTTSGSGGLLGDLLGSFGIKDLGNSLGTGPTLDPSVGNLFGQGDFFNFPTMATGTLDAPGGLTWVGENGPELMNVPKGSQVYNASMLQSLMRQGGGNAGPIPIHISLDTTPEFTAKMVGVSAKVSNQAIVTFSQKSLPTRTAQINQDPTAR